MSMTSPTAAIQNILEATFSLAGKEFFDRLVQEIANYTHAQTVLVQQLMTLESYKFSQESNTEKENYIQYKFVAHTSMPTGTELGASPPSSPTTMKDITLSTFDGDCHTLASNDQILLNRSSYSALQSDSLMVNSAVPLSSLQDTPHMDTIIGGGLHYTTQAASLMEKTTIYPSCHTYIGLRLDSLNNDDHVTHPLGVMCIMNTEPMSTEELSLATQILKAVEQRSAHELERQRKEEQLERAKEAATRDAERKLKFLADMSHEIRTPMNAVIALTDLMLQERSSLNEEQTEHLQVIQTSGHHLLTIINDILDISKLNHDPRFKLEKRRFSLRKCVKDTLHMARHQASMNQQSKAIYVTEIPSGLDDNIPLVETIPRLERSGVLPIRLPKHAHKTVLPLIWSIEPDVPDSLMGDTMRLTQIMLNLCTNAVKFTTEGGIRVRIKRYAPPTPSQSTQLLPMKFKQRYDAKIETMWTRTMLENNIIAQKQKDKNHSFSASGDGDHTSDKEKVFLEISVTDTGIGIPADRLPRLFTSFSQIDISTARRYGGTGLGLAISSTLVNHMGGGLWVESDEGVGSCFALALPMEVAPICKKVDLSLEKTIVSRSTRTAPSSPSSATSDCSATGASYKSPDISLTLLQHASRSAPSAPSASPHDINREPMTSTNASASLKDISRPCELGSSNVSTSCHLPKSAPSLKSTKDSSRCTNVNTRLSSGTNRRTFNRFRGPDSFSRTSSPSNVCSMGVRSESIREPNQMSTHEEDNLATTYPINIILAEDNILNQKIAISILKRLGYHNVTIAKTGREMDLYMPDLDGLEATCEIMSERKKGNSDGRQTLLNASEVYIIALTASASTKDRQICIDAGMNDFISKPFTLTEMRAALENSIISKRKKRRKRGEQLVYEDDSIADTEGDDGGGASPLLSDTSENHIPRTTF
ncbi:hypothetical protein DFQ30_002574 [Apophysomyces sp. BC1015]|nr:hypothetical protein DFQ30_002574 [Apophysomyces sp. BC1015]KAG0177374.1 hypothetical protein DFQ29_004922 [Apophysomyces sp. BC1021]